MRKQKRRKRERFDHGSYVSRKFPTTLPSSVPSGLEITQSTISVSENVIRWRRLNPSARVTSIQPVFLGAVWTRGETPLLLYSPGELSAHRELGCVAWTCDVRMKLEMLVQFQSFVAKTGIGYFPASKDCETGIYPLTTPWNCGMGACEEEMIFEVLQFRAGRGTPGAAFRMTAVFGGALRAARDGVCAIR
jgi:hypothetical protein